MGGKTAPSSDPEAEKKERQRKIMGIRQKVIINTVSKKKKRNYEEQEPGLHSHSMMSSLYA